MKVAVTYENNNVFQHFGKSKNFAVYEIEDGEVLSKKIISSDNQGHSELGTLLRKNGVNSLICGGIGSGAVDLLKGFSIEVFSGNSGDVDEVVNKFTKGEILKNDEGNCHHEEHHTNSAKKHCCH